MADLPTDEAQLAAQADTATARSNTRRAIIASTIGTTIEWYDFFLYGFAAALVLGKLYFPSKDPTTGTLLAFATYFGGFAARPVGAAIFGHYGDRIGRKKTLIATLFLMGLATFAVGLVPTYAAIGIWGGIILTLLRVMQGVGVGGEWGGSVLMSVEWGHKGKRGFIGSWPQFGVPAGLVLSIGALNIMNALTTPAQFLAWGWRVPFLFSIVLVGVGLYIRLGILESPVFAKLHAEGKVERTPVWEVLRLQWKEVILTALIRTGEQAPFYLFTVFVLTYGTEVLKFKRGALLNDVFVAAIVSLFSIPFWGYISDLVGRKRLYLIGATVMLLFSFPYFLMLDSKVPLLVLLAIVVSLPIHDMMYGPLAAITAEAFTGRLRYSGASLGYQLASITAGGPAPLIAIYLFSVYKNSAPIALYMAICAVVSIVAASMLVNRDKQDITVEYAEVGEKPVPEPAPA
jgi:metabolite-proton symporter